MLTPTTAVHVRRAPFDFYVGRAFAEFAAPSVRNPLPGRFGNPFKPGGVADERQRQRLLATYFSGWVTVQLAVLHNVKQEALRRMASPSEDALESFRWYLELRTQHDADFRRDAVALRGKRLGCWCKPARCHADVLASWVDAQPHPEGVGEASASQWQRQVLAHLHQEGIPAPRLTPTPKSLVLTWDWPPVTATVELLAAPGDARCEARRQRGADTELMRTAHLEGVDTREGLPALLAFLTQTMKAAAHDPQRCQRQGTADVTCTCGRPAQALLPW